MSFRITMSPERKETLFRIVTDSLGTAQGDRKKFDQRRVAIYNAYRNRPKKQDEAWRSNVSIPIITRAVERMTVQTQQTVAPRGYFSEIVATPMTVGGEVDELQRRADVCSAYLMYVFRHKMRLAEKWEPFVRSGLLYGNGYAKVWYRREFLNSRRLERMPALMFMPNIPEASDVNAEITYEKQVVPLRDSLIMLFGNKPSLKISELPKTGENSQWGVEYWDSNEKRNVNLIAEGYYDDEAGENVFLLKGKKMSIDRPEFTFISMDDIFFTLDGENTQECSRVWVRHNMDFSKVVSRYREGVFNQISESDIEDMRTFVHKDEDGDVPTDSNPIMGQTKLDTPVVKTRADAVEGAITTREQPLDVWECFMRFDLDGDDIDEEIVLWVERGTGKLLRVAHLYEDYYSDERPIVEWGLIPIENRTLKAGIGEFLFPLQVEFDTLFNMRSDAAMVTLMPGGFYRPGGGMYPTTIKWNPGAWIPVDNPQQDVLPYVPQNNPRDTINVEQFLLAIVEDLSISTYAFGRGPDRPNAPRTARGTIAILQQDSIKMDYILKRLTPAIEAICHKTLHLLRIYATGDEQFRAIGSNQLTTISPRDLDQRYMFTLDIDTVSANKEIQRSYALQALQFLGPIAGTNPDMVPPGLRRLARNALTKMEFRDADRIIPDPPGYKRPPQSQDQETVAMVSGNVIEPIMEDSHEEHLLSMDAFEQSPQFNSMPLEWVLGVWKPHKQKHVALRSQREQMMQAMLAGQGQGMSPAPGGLAPGGVPGVSRMGVMPMGGNGPGPQTGPESPGATMTGTAVGG